MKKNIQTREHNNTQVILKRIDNWRPTKENVAQLNEYLKKHDKLMTKLKEAERSLTTFTWKAVNTPYNI